MSQIQVIIVNGYELDTEHNKFSELARLQKQGYVIKMTTPIKTKTETVRYELILEKQ